VKNKGGSAAETASDETKKAPGINPGAFFSNWRYAEMLYPYPPVEI